MVVGRCVSTLGRRWEVGPPPSPLPTLLYDIAGQVEEVRRHVDEAVQDAVFLLVVGHAPLALLALGAGIAALAQALVGLHTHSSVAAGRLTFGCGKDGHKKIQVWWTRTASPACGNFTQSEHEVGGGEGRGGRAGPPTVPAEGSLPARAAAALAGGGAVPVLTVPGTSRHQQLRRLHLALALFGGVRPAAGVRRGKC